MDVSYFRYVIGTKERPTVFMMRGGEVSECVEDAHLFETFEGANAEIKNCDEPELFKVYRVTVTVCSV